MFRPTARVARLLKLLRRRGRSHEEAEDLIQEALLRLHEYCRTAKVLNEDAFLTRTVMNLAIDLHRSERRHPHLHAALEQLEDSASLFDTGPSPDEVFAVQQRLGEIERTLDAVGLRTREIYFAHRAGYSYDEISADMGISKSTIEKHIARAVLALMEMRDPE